MAELQTNGIDKSLWELKPFFTVDYESDSELLEWALGVFEAFESSNLYSVRRALTFNNLLRYKGYYQSDPFFRGNTLVANGQNPKSMTPRLIGNHTQDLVEQKISKLTKIPLNTICVPASNEYEDKIDSIIVSKVISSYKYESQYELHWPRHLRRGIIAGESFILHEWDKHRKQVGTKLVWPLDIHLFPSLSYRDCPGVLIKDYVHVEKLKADYPDVAKDITATTELSSFNSSSLNQDLLPDHALVLKFYFKDCSELPNGAYFSCTPTTILDSPQECPIPADGLEFAESGNLPLCRLTDVDIEDELHGWSSMNNINPLQNLYDKILTLMARNVFLTCQPKILVPKGGINILSMGNDASVVEYGGAVPPTIATYQPFTQDVFAFWNAIENLMEKTFGIFSSSRGAPPPGTRATSSLLFWDEQEEERQQTVRRKLENFVVEDERKILALMAAHMKKGDKKLIRTLGADKKWYAMEFDPAVFAKPYTVRPQNSSALPDNKYARIRTLSEIRQLAPNAFPEAQFLEAIDFGQHEKALDYARVAVMAAQAENEQLMLGKEIEDPEIYEDLYNHWLEHAKFFQHREFKMLPKKIQDRAIKHMKATEYLMMEQAKQNPLFSQRILTLEAYPLFFVQSDSSQIPKAPVMPMAPELAKTPAPAGLGGEGGEGQQGAGGAF